MGLQERRTIDEFQKGFFTGWKNEFNSIAGFDVPMDVKWDDFFLGAENMNQATLLGAWKDIYFTPLAEVFKKLCADDMGKTAVKEGVKKIVIEPNDSSTPSGSEFKKGVFYLRHSPITNAHHSQEKIDGWLKIIEAGL